MKALLKNDLIIRLSVDSGVEIGNIPNGISLDRLRWDGSRIVDLESVTQIHVEHLGFNNFELHVVPLSGTQAIAMRYRQRKDLRYNEITGLIYLATNAIKAEEAKEQELDTAKAKLIDSCGSDDCDLFLKHVALTAALIVYASQQPPALKNFFDSIADNIKDSFPLDRWEPILKKFAKDIKKHLLEYYDIQDR